MGNGRKMGGVCLLFTSIVHLISGNSASHSVVLMIVNSKPTETGMQRLALSDDDKRARDWFVEAVKALGCKVTIDSMGNIFAVRAGMKDGPPTFVGSHLDTQPSGGRYDGILGVTAGVEILKVLNDNWVETE